MTLPIYLDETTAGVSADHLTKSSVAASPLMLHALSKHAEALSSKGSAPSISSQEAELEEVLSGSAQLTPAQFQKLLAEIASDSTTDLSSLIAFMGTLSPEEQTQIATLLQSMLPPDQKAKFPETGTPQEQFAFLLKFAEALSPADRRQLLTNLVKGQMGNAPQDVAATANDITDDVGYLLTHLSSLSNEQFQQLISKILVEIGVFLSQVQKASAAMSQDQVTISQIMATNSHKQAQKVVSEINKKEEEEKKAQSGFWGVLGKIFGNKWVQIIITAVIGLLFCETPLGFVLLAGMIALQASGAMDKMTNWLASKMGGGPVAQFFAGVIVTVVLTGGAGLIEGGGSAIIAKTAASFAAKEGAQVGEKVVAEGVEEGATNIAKSEVEEAGAKGADKEDEGSWLTKKGRFYSNTTGMILAQSLTSTNLIYNLLISCGMDKKDAAVLAAVLNVVASLAAILGGALSGATSTLVDLMKTQGLSGLRYGMLGFQALTQTGSSTYNIHQGVTQLDYADIDKELAAPQGQLQLMEQLSKIFSQMISMSNQIFSNVFKDQSNIFSIDFSTAWSTAAQGMEISA